MFILLKKYKLFHSHTKFFRPDFPFKEHASLKFFIQTRAKVTENA